jgi:hypothetical protein
MAYDEVDHDLLEFMRAHMACKGAKKASECNLGVLESAERIYNVSSPAPTLGKQNLTGSLHWTCL